MLEKLKELWSTKLEIRVLLLSSLGLQILLFFLSGFRKRVISNRWARKSKFTWKGPLAHMFHGLLWIAYQLADYVAIVALAFLRVSVNIKDRHLLILWAPFFLVHLGGQDTITALSVEDNELWGRHLITMLTQVVLAWFNYFTINLKYVNFWPPAAIMFVVGMVKYVERVWALQRASMSALRSSMITKPDRGNSYAKFMQEYISSIQAGLNARIIMEQEWRERYSRANKAEHLRAEEAKRRAKMANGSQNNGNEGSADQEQMYSGRFIQYSEIVLMAYEFFPRFNGLFVDLILSYKDREESQDYIIRIRKTNQAYKLIEIQLSWMYEILHSKASVIYANKWYGWISRVSTLVLTVIALILFYVLVDREMKTSHYERLNITLTYVLLGAAVFLEISALISMFLSFWTYAVMKESKIRLWNCCADFLFPIQQWIHPQERSRWSQTMGQFSLINYSLLDNPSHWKCAKWLMEKLGLKKSWDHYRYTTCVDVSQKLKDLVFQELKMKLQLMDEDIPNCKKYIEQRGEWALQRKGCYEYFGWSVNAEFDESVLLWHIATDLLCNDATEIHKIHAKGDSATKENFEISKSISNYMMFLLIARPFMMPAGGGQIHFGGRSGLAMEILFEDSCEEAKSFLQDYPNIDLEEAVNKILKVSTKFDPGAINGECNKSLLFVGCKLAHGLQGKSEEGEPKVTMDTKTMWELISGVWVEMLCYAASKCSGQYHAKQLSKGGELLTVVWYLMAQLGIGRIEEHQPTAKLAIN